MSIGIVLDTEKSYAYVRLEDAIRWNKSHEELLEIAIANLDAASRGMQMQTMEKEETKWVGIETKDGFDAVRIVMPRFRQVLGKYLEEPFRFGIPNRDFLICWNREASEEFTEFVTKQMEADFEKQPYPLSPHVFETGVEGKFTELV